MGILDFLISKRKEQAKLKLPTEQPFHSVKKEATDWRNSEPHLLLLSRFLYAQKPKDAIPPHWEGVLGEPPQKVVDRFVSEGVLIPASLSVKLDRVFNAMEIKKFLKERGLRVSGRKDQGIERLVGSDPEGIAAKVAHLDIVECSSEARVIAEKFVADQKAEKEGAEGKCLEQLRLRNFRGASLTVAEFEAKQTFPRGLGVDWTKPETAQDVELLEAIFESRPKILTGLAETEWEPLRIGAAMMALWGTNKAIEWLPTNFIGIPKFDHDTAARMVLFHAQHIRDMTNYLGKWRELRIEKVKILGSGDSCPQCKTIAGKTYSVDEIPELPYEKCTHQMGCRCLAEPVI